MKKSKKIYYLITVLVIAVVIMMALINKVSSTDFVTGTDPNGKPYVTSTDPNTWEVGRYAGINAQGTDTGTDKYAKGFQVIQNKRFYCGEQGQHWKSGSYQLVSKIVINGSYISSSEYIGTTLKAKEDNSSMRANRILTEIVKRSIEQENERYRSLDHGNYVRKDVFQNVMWQYMWEWANANFQGGIPYITKPSDEYYSASYEFKEDKIAGENELNEIKALFPADKSYEKSDEKANISVVDKKDELLNSNTSVVGENTILGPFKYSYSGTVTQLDIFYDDINNKATAQVGTYNGTIFTPLGNIADLPNNQQVYISIPTKELQNQQNLNIHIKVESTTLGGTTTIYIWQNQYAPGQNMIYTDQKTENSEKEITDPYKLKLTQEVSILKQNENKEALPEIKFEIYDANNKLIGTLTSGEDGKTNEVTLQTNQVYQLREILADIYGYRGRSIEKDNISITNGEIIEVRNGVANFKITDKSVITIIDNKYIRDIEIAKTDKQNKKGIEDVSFVIRTNTTISGKEYAGFLSLYNSKGEFVPEVKGTVTINKNNIATDSSGIEYEVRYENMGKENLSFDQIPLEDLESAKITVFKTDSNGKITVKNLEVYSDLNATYNYTAYEISNPNYGYGAITNKSQSASTGPLVNGNGSISMANDRNLGNILALKVDEENKNIALADVGFVLENYTDTNKYAYIALYDMNDKLVSSITGTATINEKNVATENEYRVEYKSFEGKSYAELSDEEKAQITTFVTDDKGKILINNLEKYSYIDGAQITYKLIEVSNPHDGFEAGSTEFGNIIIENGKTFEATIPNRQKYINLSGYVWIEKTFGKGNSFDLVYTEKDESGKKIDIKLTEIYIKDENGKLILNEDYSIEGIPTRIEIKLRDKTTGEYVKNIPDDYDKNGKYTFINVETNKLKDYEVVFVYNGFYYTTITEKIDVDNGSKVKESETERKTLNDKFGEVTNEGITSVDGKEKYGVIYDKGAHTSTLSRFDERLDQYINITANTTSANYLIDQKYNELKSKGSVSTIDNINMGIVLREQPNISITSDIHNVKVGFNGYQYTYLYDDRRDYYENTDDIDIGVKFEQDYPLKRYTRTVYASDIEAAIKQDKEITVSVTYRIGISNLSRQLRIMPKEIINYFDYNYDIKAVGMDLNEKYEVTNPLGYTAAQDVEGLSNKYKSTVITFNQLLYAKDEAEGEPTTTIKNIYITFDIQWKAIKGLLTNNSTYHNATEICSYTTYYGSLTTYSDGQQFMTDHSVANTEYAGIDKMSQPGNMTLKLIDHPEEEGTQILDTTDYELDTDSAPSLLLDANGERTISGTVWEDAITNTTDNQKLGNGIFDTGEKTVANVRVELHNISDGTIATYSDGSPAIATSGEDGNYKFGGYNEETNKHVGILPGRYVISYFYNNENSKVADKKINVNEYKSTIIVSDTIKNAFESGNDKWYVVTTDNTRYSDARDKISLRPEYNPDIDKSNITVKNSTYNDISLSEMQADTPIMDIGLEFTETDVIDALSEETQGGLENVDFGIVERPDIDITVEKKITALEILAQNGTVIVPKDDPSNKDVVMKYVRTGLKGIVPVEMDVSLLQGAKLNLDYTISIQDNSDTDYEEKDYYYYGIISDSTKLKTTKVLTLVDYLDESMTLDANNTIWNEESPEDLLADGLISNEVCDLIKASGNVNVLVTHAFEEDGVNEVKLYTTKYLAVSESIRETNDVEIVELSGVRTIKESVPGNYDPTRSSVTVMDERDDDKVDFTITPPTGTNVNYIPYIIATTVTLIILVFGIVIIKKKMTK